MMTHKAEKADRVFLFGILALVIFGLASLFSASTPLGYARFNDEYFFVKGQILFGVIPGILAAVFLSKIDLKIVKKLTWVVYGLSLFLLFLVFVPGVGMAISGHRSWISLFGFSFQPAELAKLTIVVMMAYLLSQKKYDWENWQTSLVPVLAIAAPTILLIMMQPDVGTLSIIVAEVFAMLYIARVPTRYLVILGLVGIICFISLIVAAPYRAQRITTFLHPELDPKGVGYQMNQAFLAVGSGGVWGLGFGHSRQKFQYLPEVSADTIFAIMSEENGFILSAFVIFFILFLVWRGFKIAKSCHDPFGALLATGIMVWFGWQSFLNIGATVGALPLTGVPLPFVSHGGSALATALAATGLVLNASKKSTLA